MLQPNGITLNKKNQNKNNFIYNKINNLKRKTEDHDEIYKFEKVFYYYNG